MLHDIIKTFTVFKMQNRQSWYHKFSALSIIATWGIRLGITVLLYAGIYHLVGQKSVKGITLPIAISSMVLYSFYGCMGGRSIFRNINDEYISGVMEIWLNKPVPYIGLKTAQTLGESLPAAVGMLLVAAGLFFYSDLPQQTDHLALRFLFAFLLMIGGVTLAYIIYTIIGLSSIWIEDARALNMVHDKFIMIFGGIYVPIGFFPTWFRSLGEALPAGATMFMGQMFYADFLHNVPRFLAMQTLWIGVLGFCLFKISRAADKRLTVNGG